MRRTTAEHVLYGTIIVSVLVHAAFVAVLPRAEHLRPEDTELSIIELEMDPLPDPVVVPPEPLREPVTGAVVTNPSVVRPLPNAAPSDTPPAATTPPPVAELAIDAIPGRESTGPQVMRLDPRAAALSTLGRTGPAVLAPQAQAGPSESVAERDARISTELNSHLREVANFQAHLTTRPTPEPRTLPDGRISFEGVGLTMIFDPRSGDVSFTDRPGFQYEGFGSSSSGREGLTFNFDLNDGMHRRHGSDPRQSERRWLMSRTQSYRDTASDAAVATQATTAGRSVRGRLQRILDDETRPIEARRAQIFRTWDQCSEEEVGLATRRAIVAFVRERLPAGSATAFTSGEISRLNGGRRSTEPFAPY